MPQLRIVIKPGELGKFEQRLGRELKAARLRALHAVGQQATRMLAFASRPIKDLGSFGAGWRYQAAFDRLHLFNTAPHAVYVEGGRRPGAKMPPLDPIRAWVLRHGMPASAAWPVARKIARDGIKARPVLTDPKMQRGIQSALTLAFEAALAEAARRAAP